MKEEGPPYSYQLLRVQRPCLRETQTKELSPAVQDSTRPLRRTEITPQNEGGGPRWFDDLLELDIVVRVCSRHRNLKRYPS